MRINFYLRFPIAWAHSRCDNFDRTIINSLGKLSYDFNLIMTSCIGNSFQIYSLSVKRFLKWSSSYDYNLLNKWRAFLSLLFCELECLKLCPGRGWSSWSLETKISLLKPNRSWWYQKISDQFSTIFLVSSTVENNLARISCINI